MVSEDKKYISGVLRTFGFASFAPIGSILFQLLVFKKSLLDSYSTFSLLVSLVGVFLLFIGYNIVKEKTNV